MRTNDSAHVGGGLTHESEDPRPQWPAVLAHIREAQVAGTGVLVHCVAGVNRSVTTACVFLVAAGYAPSFDAALRDISDARSVANPLPSYRIWGAAFADKSSAQVA